MLKIDFEKYPLPARTRHHTNPSYYIPLKDLKFVPENYPKLIEKLNWNEIFLNGNPPKKLDIGCGRGFFLLSVADEISKNNLKNISENNSKAENILGIEVRDWCCQWLKNYIQSEQIQNCGILRYCIGNNLQFIDSNTINEIFYLFPDPWVKNKHKKRRAFNDEFLSEIYRLLEKNGKLFLATDLLEVHKYHLKTLKNFGKFYFKEIENDEEWNKPQTNKEIFCRKEDIDFYRVIAEKLS
jgi:tRNA (guanine-N7-)-methyltransferase